MASTPGRRHAILTFMFGTGLEGQDTLRAAEGNSADLDALLRSLLGEE